jgi:hypothetical protein
VARGTKFEPQWDSFRLTGTKRSDLDKKSAFADKDPNDIIFHFATKLLEPACDPDVPKPRSNFPISFGPSEYSSFGHPGGIGMIGRPAAEQPLPGSHIEYGDSCYHEIDNEIRIDVANPLDSAIVMRDTFGREKLRTPLRCTAGYEPSTAGQIVAKARQAFGKACPMPAVSSPATSELTESGAVKAASVEAPLAGQSPGLGSRAVQ